MSDLNPYASPNVDVETKVATDLPPPIFHRALLRWMLVCAVIAAPSFYFGLMFGTDAARISAMFTGILVYAIAYACAEIYWARPYLVRNPRLRRTVQIGYGSRVAISILFPVAILVDVPCGMISVDVVRSFAGIGVQMESMNKAAPGSLSAFAAILLTTLVQGALMHVLLFGYMGIVHTIQMLAGSSSSTTQRRTKVGMGTEEDDWEKD